MIEIKRTGIVRRASALLLDAILLAVLATGFMWILSLICNFGNVQRTYTEYAGAWEEYRKEYAPVIAGVYGFDYAEAEDGTVTVTKDGKPAQFEDLIDALTGDKGETEGAREAYDAYVALTETVPIAKLNNQLALMESMFLMFVTLGLLLSYLILEFIIPVCLKNGQTVGKKVFGIALVRQDCVRVKTLAVFVRAIFGKYIVETMLPIFLILFAGNGAALLSVILFAVLAIANIVLFFATKNRTPIHDLIAGTVAVDMNLQEIFDSEEELAERKALLAREAETPTEVWVDDPPAELAAEGEDGQPAETAETAETDDSATTDAPPADGADEGEQRGDPKQ